MTSGQHPKYRTAKALQRKIDDYFKNGVKKDKNGLPVPTITGLVLHCGFCDRHSFYDYEKRPIFSHTIKKARTFIEKEYEEKMAAGVSTAIFALKNFGWTDKQEIEHSGGLKVVKLTEDEQNL